MYDSIVISMDRILLKKKILESSINQHQIMIEGYRKMMHEIMTSEVTDSGEYETHQRSFKPETLAEVSILSDHLQFANQELDQLRRIRAYAFEKQPCAEYGKVVKTDKEIFFISAAIERFIAVNLQVVGLSVNSNLYKIMKGKKAGDYFTYSDIT
jgi:hypothetical protein